MEQTLRTASMLVAIGLIGAFGMAILKPSARLEPTDAQPATFTNETPDPVDSLDVHRHKHDGTQPTLERATPSHVAGVEWAPRH
jgi:hypothetical protein